MAGESEVKPPWEQDWFVDDETYAHEAPRGSVVRVRWNRTYEPLVFEEAQVDHATAALVAAAPAMYRALEAVEWTDLGEQGTYCPTCGAWEHHDWKTNRPVREHKPDCQLSAALRAARGEQ